MDSDTALALMLGGDGSGAGDASFQAPQSQSFDKTALIPAALAAYLGVISSPKHGGLGTAIARGGFAGMDQYYKAKQLDDTAAYRQQQNAWHSQIAQAALTRANKTGGATFDKDATADHILKMGENLTDANQKSALAALAENVRIGAVKNIDTAMNSAVGIIKQESAPHGLISPAGVPVLQRGGGMTIPSIGQPPGTSPQQAPGQAAPTPDVIGDKFDVHVKAGTEDAALGLMKWMAANHYTREEAAKAVLDMYGDQK